MNLFQKLFKQKETEESIVIVEQNPLKKKSIAFVDYEHWYYAMQNKFGLKPDPVSWRKSLEQEYQLEDVMVFADFGHSGIHNELTKLRNMTNTIIETQQTSNYHKKDITDFIMLDYIYQTAYSRPDINTIIIFTGDGHFHSVAKYLMQKLNKKVIIYGIRDSISRQLQETASQCHVIPTDDETLRGYYKMIVENMVYVSEKMDIIPTFNGTVNAVAFRNNVEQDVIHAALHDMIQKGLVYQRYQRVDFNRQVKIVVANWEELAKIGLWSFK